MGLSFPHDFQGQFSQMPFQEILELPRRVEGMVDPCDTQPVIGGEPLVHEQLQPFLLVQLIQYLITIIQDYRRRCCFPVSQDFRFPGYLVTGLDHVQVRCRPRLLSDNGPCYVSKDLRVCLE